MAKKIQWSTLPPWANHLFDSLRKENDTLRLQNEALTLRVERLANKVANLEADNRWRGL